MGAWLCERHGKQKQGNESRYCVHKRPTILSSRRRLERPRRPETSVSACSSGIPSSPGEVYRRGSPNLNFGHQSTTSGTRQPSDLASFGPTHGRHTESSAVDSDRSAEAIRSAVSRTARMHPNGRTVPKGLCTSG